MLPSEDLDRGRGCANGFMPTSELLQSVFYTDVNVVPEHEKEGLQNSISKLQEEILELRSKQRYLDRQRRDALNKILDIKGSIRVFCRIRSCFSFNNNTTRSLISTESEKVIVRSAGCRKDFGVDRVFTQESTQEDVFMEVKPILRSALDGHNVCIFAYGQTGTGKTFTMEGMEDRPGIVPRAIEDLFRHASQDKASSFSFSMSMLEVYMGSLKDLLAQRRPSSRSFQSVTKSGLSILTSSNGSVEVEGLTDVSITDFKQAYRWYARGKHARSTSWTNVNEASSRSHCLTRITIGQSMEEGDGVSKLWMVDLGGSERLLKTGATGQTLSEGKAINLSLSALGDVIAALKRKQNHIPYRNSKLTQILSDSLGDGSKVLMIVHASPKEDDIGETICSLNFAKRVRAIEPSRELSEDLKKQKEKWITELNQQVNDAEEELKLVRSQLERTKSLLQEKKNIFRKLFLVEEPKGSPRSPMVLNQADLDESLQTTERVIGKTHSTSLPHFMTSTACSRQRQTTAGDIGSRVQLLRLGNRNSMDFLASQSISNSEPYLKSSSRILKYKVAASGNNVPKHRDLSRLCNTDKSIDSKSSSLSRDRKVCSSHPELRVTLHQHRRRISDLT